MYLHTHLWTSALAGFIIYPRSPHQAALTGLAGVLVDLDHLLVYSLRTGDWSLTGALHYNRYRNRPPVPGDTRPRYGSLRSWLHNPLLLPLAGALAWRCPALRPIACGLALHILLDNYDLPVLYQTLWRAGGHCEWCGCRNKLKAHSIFQSSAAGERIRHRFALCERCYKRYLHSEAAVAGADIPRCDTL